MLNRWDGLILLVSFAAAKPCWMDTLFSGGQSTKTQVNPRKSKLEADRASMRIFLELGIVGDQSS
jgi:hypothetical protein